MRRQQQHRFIYIIAICIVTISGCQRQEAPVVSKKVTPKVADRRIEGIDEIRNVIRSEIQKGTVPGAVVLIGNNERILYHEAFGCRSIIPEKMKMQKEDIFDLASLSKPVSTAGCILILVDRGQLTLNTKVSDLIPAFGVNQKQDIEIHHLLTHTSGLPAYTNAEALKKQYGDPCKQQVLENIYSMNLQSQPGQVFRYSCLGYITLGRIVEVVSGQTLDAFAHDNLFAPLGMQMTGYNPSPALNDRLVPTEVRNGQCLIGRVHDPLAELMGGVSGNAGVFSTAPDLAKYYTMVLNNGKAKGKQILSENSVRLLTTPQKFGRAYGFDVSSPYANIKGDFFSSTAFCHSGYTGTSIVCDPEMNLYMIILTNRVHPEDKGSVKKLRIDIANITAKTFNIN